jgi:hypothetical protein
MAGDGDRAEMLTDVVSRLNAQQQASPEVNFKEKAT